MYLLLSMMEYFFLLSINESSRCFLQNFILSNIFYWITLYEVSCIIFRIKLISLSLVAR